MKYSALPALHWWPASSSLYVLHWLLLSCVSIKREKKDCVKVFCCPSQVTFSRQELLNIQQSSFGTFPPFYKEQQRVSIGSVGDGEIWQARGKWEAALVTLRQIGCRAPLPLILLVNVHPQANKLDQLLLLIPKDPDQPPCASLKPGAVNSSWTAPYNSQDLSSSEGTAERLNKGWCVEVTVQSTYCSPHLETLSINCWPFYLFSITAWFKSATRQDRHRL